jgi:protoheme ferro-lyase
MKAILIVDIGTPASTAVADIYDYLNCLYSDPFILPEFAGQAPRYQLSDVNVSNLTSVDASPILQRVVDAIQTQWQWPATYAYRYGDIGITRGIQYLLQETNGQLDHLHIIPLFPQRTALASQSIKTAMHHYISPFKIPMSLTVQKPYITTAAYQLAIAEQLKQYDQHMAVIAGFHGASVDLIKKMDPTRITCLSKPNCCENPSPVSDGCSRRQAHALCNAIDTRIQPVFLDHLFVESDAYLDSSMKGRDLLDSRNTVGLIPNWITPSITQQLDSHYLDCWVQSKCQTNYTRLPNLSPDAQYQVIVSSIGLNP